VKDVKGNSNQEAFQGPGDLALKGTFRPRSIGPEGGPGAGGIAFKPDQVCLQFVYLGPFGLEQTEKEAEKKN
jgi:hypothetical protein